MNYAPGLLLPVMLMACCGLSGCVIPYPSTTQRSPEIRGRIVDAESQEPIEKARVALQQHASISTRSDASGRFRLRGTRNHHLLLIPGPCGGEWPVGKYYGSELEISHPGYAPLVIQARQHLSTNTTERCLVLPDVPLTQVAR